MKNTTEKTLSDLEEIKQSNFKKFWLGPIVAIHEIGEIGIVEYIYKESYSDTEGEHAFSVYLRGERLGKGAQTLEGALAVAIAYKFDGCNSHAGSYFMRMVGNELHKDYVNIVNRTPDFEPVAMSEEIVTAKRLVKRIERMELRYQNMTHKMDVVKQFWPDVSICDNCGEFYPNKTDDVCPSCGFSGDE